MIFFYFSKKKNCSGCKYMFRLVSTMSCLRESFGVLKKKIWKKKYSNNGKKNIQKTITLNKEIKSKRQNAK